MFYFFSSAFSSATVLPKHLLGVFVSGLLIVIGGILDDRFNLRPARQIFFPILAIAFIIVSGIDADWITNPFSGSLVGLNQHDCILFWYHGLPYKITLWADLFTFVWLLGLTYTTKLLDGVDGLVSGLTVIGSIFIFITAITNDPVQFDVALLALILAGAFGGFLMFNFNPAKIFLGEGGSLLSGFMLGVLSILSGSRVAITLIIMGIPVIDVFYTIIRRLRGGHNPFKTSDKKHLHHRLLEAGLSVRQTVALFYVVAIILGAITLFVQRLPFGIFSVLLMIIFTYLTIRAYIYRKLAKKVVDRPLD